MLMNLPSTLDRLGGPSRIFQITGWQSARARGADSWGNTGVIDNFLAAFVAGTAKNSAQHILYDTTDGRLFYDADGSGSQARIHFATLNAGLALDHLDFMVI